MARAGVEQEMGHADLAMVDLEEALRLQPTSVEAYLMRGELYLAQKKNKPSPSGFREGHFVGGAPGRFARAVAAVQVISTPHQFAVGMTISTQSTRLLSFQLFVCSIGNRARATCERVWL